jgi:mannose-6-phosphate isomerase-like protein (cupin superfamily)
MTNALTVGAGEKESFDFGGLSVCWKVDGNQTGGRFSVVHHPLAPHALAAPLHYHHMEDELSYVLTGRVGALLGDVVVTAEPGTWVFKAPAAVAHVLERRRDTVRNHRSHLAGRL